MNRFDQSNPQFHGVCPKTGKPIVRPRLSGWAKWLFPVIGVLSLIWFLVRVLPKPSRAAYPCQRAAAPLASSFVLWLLSMGGCTLAFRHAKQKMYKARFAIGGVLFVLGVGSALLAVMGGPGGLAHANMAIPLTYEDVTGGGYQPIDGTNAPVGVGQGIHPGRVAWVYDPVATNANPTYSGDITWGNTDGSGFYWDENHCNQSEVNTMVPKAVCYLTGDATPTAAWDDIFRYFNTNHSKGDIGYQQGEKIAIKLNFSASLDFGSSLIDPDTSGLDDQNYLPVNPTANNTALYAYSTNDSDPTPQAVIALLNQLVNVAGVPQQDIYIGDPIRPFTNYIYTRCYAQFPNVNYMDSIGQAGRTLATYTNAPCLFYSTHPTQTINGVFQPGVEMSDQIADYIYNADYFINFPILKREGSLGETCCGKNTFGVMNRSPEHLHNYVHGDGVNDQDLDSYSNGDWGTGWGTYNCLVDHLGNKYLGGKTLLYMADGLYGGWWSNGQWSMPEPWMSMPATINGTTQPWWPSSILVSQDPIALDSVVLDFLSMECNQLWPSSNPNVINGLANCADNYQIEAALANNPPSGTFYDPNRTGTRLQSLGVHERWNDPVHKQYTRNLGTGQGIELVTSPTTTVSVSPASIPTGQSGTVNIVMDAQGTESALGFGLNFDPTQLQFVTAQLVTSDSTAYLEQNTTNAASGQLGFALAAQPTGSAFTAGTQTILQVTFTAIGTGPTTAVTFGSVPVIEQVSDVNALPLPSTFTDGTVTITGSVSTPTITSFTPTSGPQGTVVTITGTNFTGATAVSFGGTAAASFSVTNTTTISATVGSGATGAVTVTTPNGNATSSGTFTFSQPPTVTSFTPTSGPQGTVVTITGTNFTGASAVSFGGIAAASFSVTNTTTISATVGSGATGTVSVTTPGGTATSSGTFTFSPPPTVTSFTPTNGPQGTVVTITGTNFTGASAVSFGGTAAASFSVTNTTTISATVGSGATGTVSVTTPNGTATSSATFTFTTGPQLIISPSAGANGAISPSTQQVATPNGSIPFTALPSNGYVVDKWSVDGTVVQYGGTQYTLSNITANHSITVTFMIPLTALALTIAPPSPSPVNTPIQLTATPTGGSTLEYKFYTIENSQMVVVQNYSASSTCTWTPTISGTYTVVAWVREQGTTVTFTQFASATYVVTAGNQPLTAVAAAFSPVSPQPANTPITITATATGGTNVTYQFWAYAPAANPAWSQLQAYSSTATCPWTPTASGNYLISVTAQDGVTGTQVNTTAWYTIANSTLTAVSFTPSPSAPQLPNTPITLTAAATGGTNVQYQFWLYNPAANPAWTQLQAYSALDSCTWTPRIAGNYLISVTAMDGVVGNEVNTTAWYTIANSTLTAVSVTPSPTSPQAPNTPITFTAKATGGTNVQYQFWLYNPAANPAWSQLQAFSATATCPWTPTVSGNYLLSVTAQDGVTGTQVNTTCWYTIANSALTAVNVTSSPISPQPINTQITYTATATGGTNVQYQFWLYNPAANPAWSQLLAFSAQASCSWTPTVAGSYLISVTAQDGVTGTQVNTSAWYTVTASTSTLTAVNFTPSPTSPQLPNTQITLTAVATGGTNVQYQFWLYNPAASPAWSQLQAYSAQATSTWTPTVAGSYLISVTAEDGVTGAQVNTSAWYTIN